MAGAVGCAADNARRMEPGGQNMVPEKELGHEPGEEADRRMRAINHRALINGKTSAVFLMFYPPRDKYSE